MVEPWFEIFFYISFCFQPLNLIPFHRRESMPLKNYWSNKIVHTHTHTKYLFSPMIYGVSEKPESRLMKPTIGINHHDEISLLQRKGGCWGHLLFKCAMHQIIFAIGRKINPPSVVIDMVTSSSDNSHSWENIKSCFWLKRQKFVASGNLGRRRGTKSKRKLGKFCTLPNWKQVHGGKLYYFNGCELRHTGPYTRCVVPKQNGITLIRWLF